MEKYQPFQPASTEMLAHTAAQLQICYYAPYFKEVEGAYCFGVVFDSVCVCVPVTLFVRAVEK